MPLGFGRRERDHRALDGEQIALAIARRAQRPADMRGDRRIEQRMPKTPDRIAIGIDRLHEHRIGRRLDRRFHRMIAQPQFIQHGGEIHQWQPWESLTCLGKRHQCSRCTRREPAVRRRDVVLHPFRQRDQQRAHERAIAERIAGQLHDRLCQRPERRMRHACNRIDARLVRHRDVGAVGVGGHQRGTRLPDVALGIEVHHLRTHAGIASTLQDAAGAAADRIAQRRIAERKLVVAVRVVLMLARIAAGLRELPVDAGPSRSGDDRQNAIEHPASRKVLVEAIVHQITQHPATLRYAEAERVADARSQRIAFRRMAQERHDVADRREADAHHDRIARAVDELEDRAAIEAWRGRPGDLDMAVIDQPPRQPGRRNTRIGLTLAHRQRRTRRIGDRIHQRADETVFRHLLDIGIAEQPGCLGDELLTDHAGDAIDDREACGQTIVAGRHVALPPAPHQREAAAHQEAVAGVARMAALRRAVQSRHDRLVAAVGHVVDQPAIAARNVNRLQNAELGLILDVAACIARRLVQIDDAGVQRMCWIELAERRAMQPFIGTDRTEFLTAKYRRFPFVDLDPPHAAAVAPCRSPRQ